METNNNQYKFFYDSVKNGIVKDYGNSINDVTYSFFNQIKISTDSVTYYINGGIEKTKINIKILGSDNIVYKAIFYDGPVETSIISEEFRDSKSFQPNDTNSYETSYFHFMISEKGFAVYKKINFYAKNQQKSNNENSEEDIKNEQKDTADQVFYRILVMYLLALAYNHQMDKLSNLMAKIYSKKANNKLLENFVESIHAFDLQYFFENPVKMDRYQTYNLWKIIAENYNIKTKHDEIKSQVLSLAEIISRNKEIRFHKKITRLGILLAAIPIIIEIPIPYNKLMEINFINKFITLLSNISSGIFELIKAFFNGLI